MAATAAHLARARRNALGLRRWEAMLLAQGLADEATARFRVGADAAMGPCRLDELRSPWRDAAYMGGLNGLLPFAPLEVSTFLEGGKGKDLCLVARVRWHQGRGEQQIEVRRPLTVNERELPWIADGAARPSP